MDNEFYCLKLNNCNVNGSHYISFNECSFILDVLKKEYTYFDLDTISDDFLELDYKIKEDNNKWVVYGMFPVIGYEKNGRMYDFITNEEIKYSKDGKDVLGLSYNSSCKVNYSLFILLNSLINDEVINNYKEGLALVSKNSLFNYYCDDICNTYHLVRTTNFDNGMSNNFYAVNGYRDCIDMITGDIYHDNFDDDIICGLSFSNKEDIYRVNDLINGMSEVDKKKYIADVDEYKRSAIRYYNIYKSFNNGKEFDKRSYVKSRRK